MNTRVIYMTEEGLARARADLARKMRELREICDEREVAHALSGDGWHDNPHFNRLQQLEADKTRDIVEQQGLLERTRLIRVDLVARPCDRVAIGSIVEVEVRDPAQGTRTTQVWEIGGYNDTDVAAGRLAYNSPLAAALMGREAGEDFRLVLPGGTVMVDVLDLLTTRPV